MEAIGIIKAFYGKDAFLRDQTLTRVLADLVECLAKGAFTNSRTLLKLVQRFSRSELEGNRHQRVSGTMSNQACSKRVHRKVRWY